MGLDTPTTTNCGPWTSVIKTPWALNHLQKHLVGLGISVKTHREPWNLGIETPWALIHPQEPIMGLGLSLLRLMGLDPPTKILGEPWNFSKNPRGPWNLGIETPWALIHPQQPHHGPWTFIIKTLVGLDPPEKTLGRPWNFSKTPLWALELGYLRLMWP